MNIRRRILTQSISLIGGDIEIDTTYAIYYTSTDGAVVTPYETNAFGANIVSNTYENGKGIIVFDGNITSIGKNAFYSCTSLTSVTIPNSVTSIRSHAFAGCSSLTSITIPNSVTSIGEWAFHGCSSLTSVTIPNSVTSIGNAAFYSCGFTSVTIPDSVTSIGSSAFRACRSLTSVTIPDSVTSFKEDTFSLCTSLTNVTIPDSVTSIGGSTFYNCSSLTNVTIGDGVTKIGEMAFTGCIRLTTITIPDSVTSIGTKAFSYCSSLTSITIPDSVTSIGTEAFYGCSSLTSVYCEPITPPTGGSDMFANNVSTRQIYVPTNSVEAYKSAQYWSVYANYIEGYDFEEDCIVLTPNATTDDNRRAYELINSQAVFDGIMSYDWVPTTTKLLISGEVDSTTIYQETVRLAYRDYGASYYQINFASLYNLGFVSPMACLYPDGYFEVYDDD